MTVTDLFDAKTLAAALRLIARDLVADGDVASLRVLRLAAERLTERDETIRSLKCAESTCSGAARMTTLGVLCDAHSRVPAADGSWAESR